LKKLKVPLLRSPRVSQGKFTDHNQADDEDPVIEQSMYNNKNNKNKRPYA
jgi:hypothetical protein